MSSIFVPLDSKREIEYSFPLFFSQGFKKSIVNNSSVQIYYGGAGSGKSVTIARRTILDMMAGQRNYLVIRKVYGTLKDSFYTELLKAISDLGLSQYFKSTKSPLEIKHIASGNVILFRGLDDKEKIKSITAPSGAITDIIIEEATEITEEDYDMLDTRLRGFSSVPKRITILFNPIYKEHWIYERFFEGKFMDDDTYKVYDIPVSYTMLDDDGNPYQIEDKKTVSIHKSTHKDNKFLLPEDHARYEAFKVTNPYYYDVYCNGNWGVLGDLIFTNWRVADLTEVAKTARKIYFGLDYGYDPDPSALVAVTVIGNKIYILKEIVQNKLSAKQLYNMVRGTVGDRLVISDRDERLTRELRELGLNIKMVTKRQGGIGSSNLYNIQWWQNYEIVVDYRCVNYIREIKSYVRDTDKNGNTLPNPKDGNDHCIQAGFYSCNDVMERLRPIIVG